MLDVKKLRILREIAVHGSITAAARTLRVTASSVSQQVSKLEREQRVTLLEPHGRGIRLTPAAELLVARTEAILASLEEAEAELAVSRESRRTSVHLVAFHTFATGLLGEVIRHLAVSAPSVTLRFTQLDPDAAITELLARRADIVVADEYQGFPLPPIQGVVRQQLGVDPIGLYLPARESDPGAVPWAMEPPTSDATKWGIARCREAGFEPNVRFESPDPFVRAQLVDQGIAAAFFPLRVARQIGLTISEQDLPGADLGRVLISMARRGTERSPGIAACTSALIAVCSELT